MGEIFEFSEIVNISATHEVKPNRLRRLKKSPLQSSDRSSTPHLPKFENSHIKIKSLTHSRSYSRTPILNNTGKIEKIEKRVQFLQGSRFNRRIIDGLTEVLIEKMSNEPEYLIKIKESNLQRYQCFKEEYIDIHKNSWMQEAIKQVENSELLRATTEDGLKLIDAKKEAFFSYICNEQLLKSIILKAKQICLRN